MTAVKTALSLGRGYYRHQGKTYETGRENAAFLASNFEQLPDAMAERLAFRYCDDWGQHGRAGANRRFREAAEKVPRDAVRLAASDTDLIDYAEAMARRCWRMAHRAGEGAAEVLAEFVTEQGYRLPEGQDVTTAGMLARFTDPMWWRRAIRIKQGRDVEGVARDLGMVHKRAGIYSSDDTVKRRKQQKGRNRRTLEAMMAINELGEEFTLAELSDLSTSNPIIRRSELMVRMAGFEEVARESGHVAEFYTLTCPSAFHARHVTGHHNSKYNGSTPREAQAHLQKTWARIRAELHRRGFRWYGFRVAEPHHDGTPHWHLLLFFSPSWPGSAKRAAVPRVRAIIRRHALAVDGNEPGARERRFTAKAIDWNRGSATGYIAKYVAKNIDGYGIEADLYGIDIGKAVERVDAWASTWGIRQFQQIGGPPVTVWRELRRFEGEEDGLLGRAVECADRGDWAGYVGAMGGPFIGRGDSPIRVATLQEINTETGELPQNKYGELQAGQVAGLEVGNVIHVTRWHNWRIEHGKRSGQLAGAGQRMLVLPGTGGAGDSREGAEVVKEEPAASVLESGAVGLGTYGNASNTGDFGLSGATAPPWSSVNNCTGENREFGATRTPYRPDQGDKGGGGSTADEKSGASNRGG